MKTTKSFPALQKPLHPHEWFWVHPIAHPDPPHINETGFALDIGFDRGSSALWLAEHSRARAIIAIDCIVDHAKLARVEFAKAYGCKKLLLVQADAHNLPFKDGSFDRVLMRSVLQYMATDRAVSESRRVLQSQGVFEAVANLKNNPIILCYRLLRPLLNKRPGILPRKYLTPRRIDAIFGSASAQYFHLLTPLFMFLSVRMSRSHALWRLFCLLVKVEHKIVRTITPLRSLCWYAGIKYINENYSIPR